MPKIKKRFDYEATMPYQDDAYFMCLGGKTRDTAIAHRKFDQNCWKLRRDFLKALGLLPGSCWIQNGVIQALRWDSREPIPTGWKVECKLAAIEKEPKEGMVRLILDGKTGEGRKLMKTIPAHEKSTIDFANELGAPWLNAGPSGWGSAQRVRFPHYIILGEVSAAKAGDAKVICVVPLVRNHEPWVPPGSVQRLTNSQFWQVMEKFFAPNLAAENKKFRGGKPWKAKPGHFSAAGRFGDDEG